MRISGSSYPDTASRLPANTPGGGLPLANIKTLVGRGGAGEHGVQFGQAPAAPASVASPRQQQLPSLLSLLFKGRPEGQPTDTAFANALPGDAPATESATGAPAELGAVALVASPTGELATPAKPPEAAKSPEASFLDDSKYSSPKDLERWAPLVADLPPDQRDQAAKELNRPIAAARMAAEKGPDGEKAMKFINDNPALKTAVDTGKHGGNADGKITDGDLKAFAKNMQKSADNADKDLANYQKDNPNADPQSLQMVRSASLLQANDPLTKAADPKHALGADGKTKIDNCASADGLKALTEGNPGLAGSLKQASKTWSQPGFLGQLDQAGLEGRALAGNSPDQKFNSANISNWIKKQAPTNGGEFAGMLSDAATLNSVANVDISKLDKQVFDNPAAYTGEQKAAVMIKLQQTQQSVVAGRDLRKTEKTEDALAEKIGQLQNDPDVKVFMDQSVPAQERSLVGSDPALQKAVTQQFQAVNSGQAMQADIATADKATSKDAPNADYSRAIGGLSSQLQMQKDLLGDGASVPTADQVLNKRPDIQSTLKDSYIRNFSEGGTLKQSLSPKKADANDALQAADAQKAMYDSVLPDDFVQGQQSKYVKSTFAQLNESKSGRKLLEGSAGDKDHGPSMAAQVASMGPAALQSVAGFASVSDMLARGDKTDAAKTIYDSTKSGLSAAKQGYDAVSKFAGREASAGLGRMAGSIAGRAVGMVAGEAAGMAAGAAVGASIPVIGWVVDAAMALGFGITAIIEAVKKHKAQQSFDHNVDPTLEQFGIPKSH